MHVTPAVSNHEHMDVVSFHTVDDAVGLEENQRFLPVRKLAYDLGRMGS